MRVWNGWTSMGLKRASMQTSGHIEVLDYTSSHRDRVEGPILARHLEVRQL